MPQQHNIPYLPALDGLRALAVIGVLLYHVGLSVLGGFLGVESFFVLSGFLITTLLLAEWRGRGSIDLRSFWLRRARRLLPALFLMLGGTLAIASLLPRGAATGLGPDMLAALGYVMNWHLIWNQQAYFDPTTQPPLLQHLWSLAVEEQFYLLWPLLFAGGIRLLRPRALLLVILAASIASIALMAALYEPGADLSRVYYGTDTRAAGLLIGSALALAWAPGRIAWPNSRTAGRALDALGMVALGGLIASYVWLYETHPLLYQGGFAAVALATAAVIMAAVHPAARMTPALLSWQSLRWIGQRSYGIYLWHWPIFIAGRAYEGSAIGGWPLLILQLASVVTVAELSYRFVEMPVRRGALGRAWQALVERWAFWPTMRRPPMQAHSAPWRLRWVSLLLVNALLLSGSACTSIRSTAAAGATTTIAAGPNLAAASPAATSFTPAHLDLAQTAEAAPGLAGTAIAEAPPSPAAPAPAAASTPTPASAEAQLEPFDPDLAVGLQHILDETVADGFVPGVQLAVSVPGQQTWIGASGSVDLEGDQPMLPTTNVRIASVSKMFTAVVVLQLVEEGLLELDTPIAKWLPDIVPNADAITVRQLLSHTSGLYDYLEDRNFVKRAYDEPDRLWAPRELVEYATQFAPSFEPGAPGRWDYSSTNYVILGMLVEQVTGKPLADELRQRIFEPLKLERTYFVLDGPPPDGMAHGYSNTLDQTDVSMSFAFATANIVSNVDDLQRFVRALLGGELLQDETLHEVYEFVDGHGSYKMPALEYGLGMMRNTLPVGPGPDGQERPADASTVLGHIGGFGGFRTAIWSAPDSGISIALSMNQAATDPNTLAEQVWDAILTSQGR